MRQFLAVILIVGAACLLPSPGNGLLHHAIYKAAVVEYAAQLEPFLFPQEVLERNADGYATHIAHAARRGASIIVFPEDGLTTLDVAGKTPQKLNNYSVEVPDPQIKPNPRINESMHKILRILSVAASEYQIYVVVNLIEKFKDVGLTFYYNTVVVFDRTGLIIVRYRKHNLLNEPKLNPGHELAVFRADFGVTFGILTCNDMLYKRPGVDILQHTNVTDIILPTAWYSETPYTQSLSLQAGYARAAGVNLLAAGLSHPPMYGGSGIYLHDGRIAELYISPSKSSKLLLQDVPKSHVRLSALKCHNNSHETPRFRLGGALNQGAVNTPHEDMRLHTMQPLNFHDMDTKVKLCNFDGEFCCRFHVVMQERPGFHEPKYMLALFYGVRQLGDTTVGVRSCGVVACLDKDNRSTCGMREHHTQSSAVFKQISISGDFQRDYNRNFDLPITLSFDQTPITAYTYCETLKEQGQRVVVDMRTTRPMTNLLSFGIFGRLFDYDGRRLGLITSSSTRRSPVFVSICIFLFTLIFTT